MKRETMDKIAEKTDGWTEEKNPVRKRCDGNVPHAKLYPRRNKVRN